MTLYIWDEARRADNLRRHGLDFADARAVFAAGVAVFEDRRFYYGERRFNAYGRVDAKTVCITYAERNYGRRIISFRKATWKEEANLLGAG